jgi:hypothetical protein
MNLPLLSFEEYAISRTAVAVSIVRDRLNKEWGREWLETMLRQRLREGELTIAEKAVEAAHGGDEIADAALREVGAELQMVLVQRRDLEPGHLQIIAYFQSAGKRTPLKRKRGRAWIDEWYRNIVICVLIELTCRESGVSPTRNRESRRSERSSSGISIVVAALARNQIHIKERTVQETLWFGLPGELARRAVADRPPEMLFAALHVPNQIP